MIYMPDAFHLAVCLAYLIYLAKSQDFMNANETEIENYLIDNINSTRIRNYIKEFSSEPHLAGSDRQKQTAEQIHDIWLNEFKLDNVKIETYEVLLSYPNTNLSNEIRLVDEGGESVWRSSVMDEDVLNGTDNSASMVRPYNAFAKSGNVTGELLYVNYGSYSDFDALAKQGLNCSGKIAIARYGKMFRGTKASNAQHFNCEGLILYTDPVDYAQDGIGSNQTFPNTWWLPKGAVQRGSVNTGSGDALTIGFPSKPYSYREIPRKGVLPTIPVLPIGYGDAMHLLCDISGSKLPSHWFDKNSESYLDCESNRSDYKTAMNTLKVNLEVNNELVNKTIHVVIGRINGRLEPDRYVIMGNHRDAWSLGASDPVSGTGCLLEMTRVFGDLVKRGWRPKRTIIFGSWDAEEFGLIGSTEWVEQNLHVLKERGVAYLNIDTAVAGNYSLRIRGSPYMSKAIFDAAKKVPNPNPQEIEEGRKTMYETWLTRTPDKEKLGAHQTTHPLIEQLGSSSDFVAFQYLAGVPSIDIKYYYDQIAYPVSNYPAYHTRYDTFHGVTNFIDPDFTFHRAIAQFTSIMALQLASSSVLPLSPTIYAQTLKNRFHAILGKFTITLKKYGICTSYLDAAIDTFANLTNELAKNLDAADVADDLSDPQSTALKLRMLNDKLIMLDKGFLDVRGVPTNTWFKHLILAPSSEDQYSGSSFPGLTELLNALEYLSKLPSTKNDTTSVMNPIIRKLMSGVAGSKIATLNSPVLSDAKLYSQLMGPSLQSSHCNNSIDWRQTNTKGESGSDDDTSDGDQLLNMENFYRFGHNVEKTVELVLEALKKHIAVLTHAFYSVSSVLID